MQNSEKIWQLVDARKDAYEALSDRVWGMPEICYTEYRSVAEHRAMLEQEGFRITENLAGIPTAVMGEAGEGGPVIAILGEYDALPGLSQVAGIAEPKEVERGGHGHGCGHNMLGSAALLAATAVKNYLAEAGIKGRVRYYGCPAEEGGAAKVFMVRAGHFEDVDIAITWHPAAINRVDDAMSLANTRIDFTFKGRASHAAAAPHLGPQRARCGRADERRRQLHARAHAVRRAHPLRHARRRAASRRTSCRRSPRCATPSARATCRACVRWSSACGKSRTAPR